MPAEPSARDLYTERAGAYHRFVSVVRYPQALRAALRNLESLRSDMKILDAGCGGGLVTLALREALASRGFRPGVVHGFDLTPEMLDRFRAVLKERDLSGIELRQADVLQLDPLPDSWRDYDLIVSSGMLEYLPRDQLSEALRGLRLRLKQDGALVFFISRRNCMNHYLIQLWWNAQLYTREELAASVAKAGFSQVRFRRFPVRHRHLGLWGHIVEARR
jgi:cyclopropane fatty-acyl-phospholipid synthase-like methyltransferase